MDVDLNAHDLRTRLNAYQKVVEKELDELKKRTAIVRQFTHIQNLTPLLLPLNNFISADYQAMMRRLFEQLGTHDDPSSFLKDEMNDFFKRHPRTYPSAGGRHGKGQHCLTDGIHHFKSPGRHRHGFYRPTRDHEHPMVCLLNARSRLGGAYSHNFHFDCEAISGGLNRHYPNCHGAPCPPKENHVNIAPNDYII